MVLSAPYFLPRRVRDGSQENGDKACDHKEEGGGIQEEHCREVPYEVPCKGASEEGRREICVLEESGSKDGGIHEEACAKEGGGIEEEVDETGRWCNEAGAEGCAC